MYILFLVMNSLLKAKKYSVKKHEFATLANINIHFPMYRTRKSIL